MPHCETCTAPLVRVRRSLLERLLYAEAFECRPCRRRIRRLHAGISIRYNFVVSGHARCTNCGTAKVQRVAKRDLLDGLSTNVASQLQRLTFAPLNRCAACRLQFYDWRPTAPPNTSTSQVQPRPHG